MKPTILVAGGTGNLGERIIKALSKRGAEVGAIIRNDSEPEKSNCPQVKTEISISKKSFINI